jgi:hypothetical protein
LNSLTQDSFSLGKRGLPCDLSLGGLECILFKTEVPKGPPSYNNAVLRTWPTLYGLQGASGCGAWPPLQGDCACSFAGFLALPHTCDTETGDGPVLPPKGPHISHTRAPQHANQLFSVQHFKIKTSLWGCLSHRRIQCKPCLRGDW